MKLDAPTSSLSAIDGCLILFFKKGQRQSKKRLVALCGYRILCFAALTAFLPFPLFAARSLIYYFCTDLFNL